MRVLCLLGLLLIPVHAVVSQEPAPAGFKHWTASDFDRVSQSLAKDAGSDPHHFAVELLSDFPNEAFMLVRREADGQAEWHENQLDVMLIQSGSGTLIVGGTLQNGETVGPHEKRNGTIEGARRIKVSAGDVLRIPPKTPHQLLLDGAHQLVYFVVMVKGYGFHQVNMPGRDTRRCRLVFLAVSKAPRRGRISDSLDTLRRFTWR